jgi:hypothetical protein
MPLAIAPKGCMDQGIAFVELFSLGLTFWRLTIGMLEVLCKGENANAFITFKSPTSVSASCDYYSHPRVYCNY